jgi:DNA invertase Pin-like site-specific DNA recombinase
MQTTTRKRAVLFIRVNHRGVGRPQTAAALTERQRAIGQTIADQLGASVVREYIDSGGAVRIEDRVELQAMLADLADMGNIDYVIASDPARLSRNVADYIQILGAVQAAGALIATPEIVAKGEPEEVYFCNPSISYEGRIRL